MTRKETEITLREALTEFLMEKKAMGLQPKTLDNYILSLQVFMSENGWDDLIPIKSLTKDRIIKWISVRLENGSNRNTINHYLREIKSFSYWCQDKGYIESYRISLVKSPEPEIKRYTEDELKVLLVPPKKSDSFTTWRSWILVNLALGTGARLNSMRTLKLDDINFTDNSITYHTTKNGHYLVLPLTEKLVQAIRLYLRTWDISGYILCSDQGEMATTHSLEQAFDRYCGARGITSQGVHALRHTFSYLMYKNGTDIITIQYFLGHRNIELTRHYIGKLSRNDVSQAETPLDTLFNCNLKPWRK